jgi:hypothetical protein
MTLPSSEVRFVEADGTFRRTRSSVTRRPAATLDEVQDPERLSQAMQRVSRDIEALQRTVPRPRVIFRVLVETGAGYTTHRLRHGLGGSVVVRLDSIESTYAGTFACRLNYRTDESDDSDAVVHIEQSPATDFYALVSVESI